MQPIKHILIFHLCTYVFFQQYVVCVILLLIVEMCAVVMGFKLRKKVHVLTYKLTNTCLFMNVCIKKSKIMFKLTHEGQLKTRILNSRGYFFCSPELKTQVSFPDRLLSVVPPSICKLFIISSQELQSQFQPAQSIFG